MSHLLEHQNADERLASEPATGSGLPATKTGTAEWAASTLNVAKGCRHGCLYCYARFNALRYHQIATGAEWSQEHIYTDRVEHAYRGGRGRIMMPSSHDITPATVDAVATVCKKLLEAPTPLGKPQTRLLLVTKADGPAIGQLCQALDESAIRNPQSAIKSRVLWRLTIGCLDDRCRQFWEPGAPDIDMRLEVLRWLYKAGWQTSVSCEPLLEPRRAVDLVTTVAPFVTDTIWIGAARELRARTAWCRNQTSPAYTAAGMRTLENAISNLEIWQQPSAILRVAESVRGILGLRGEAFAGDKAWAKVRWKDSYAQVLRQHGWRIEEGRLLEQPAQEAIACDE